MQQTEHLTSGDAGELLKRLRAAGVDAEQNGTKVTATFKAENKEAMATLLRSAHNSALATNAQTILQRVKTGRNEPCPCGSGRKFKRCHG